MVNPVHQVMKELHSARVHLEELDEALMAYARAGWMAGTQEQRDAWEKVSSNRERQAGRVAALEVELRNLLR
jgi:hypothetical protein